MQEDSSCVERLTPRIRPSAIVSIEQNLLTLNFQVMTLFKIALVNISATHVILGSIQTYTLTELSVEAAMPAAMGKPRH